MTIDLKDLLPKIYSLKNQPNDIPYVTSYYKRNWGFCLEDKVKKNLPQGKYRVFINSKLEEGYLDQTEVGQQAHNMALQVIQKGLCNVSEYYGSEATLYYPGLYAGQTDLVAIHKCCLLYTSDAADE